MIDQGDQILPELPDAVSVPRAGKMLGVSRRTADELVKAGKLRCFTPSKQRRVYVADVLAYRRAMEMKRSRRFRKPVENSLAD